MIILIIMIITSTDNHDKLDNQQILVRRIRRLGAVDGHLSITHTKENAMAQVILESGG